MQLNTLVNKPVFVGNCKRGICIGFGISLKTKTVKYLLCHSDASSSKQKTEYAIAVSSVVSIEENALFLARFRCVYPKNCTRVFLGMPIYTHSGIYLGKLLDIQAENWLIHTLSSDEKYLFTLSSLFACNDAIILRKTPIYPLGQRIPAPAVSAFLDKKEQTVTKSVLKSAIENKTLIRLTLSLAPFFLETL